MPDISKAKSEALAAALAQLRVMTDEEDEAITRAADADPDARPMTDGEFAHARRGRPRLAQAKRAVSVRVDPDVLERLRAGGPGWQTRMNAMLRSALGMDG